MSYTNGLDNPELYFQAKNYSGNASTNAITLDGSENMQPDMVWLKSRSFSQNHEMYDSVRTATKRLYPNGSYAEDTNSTGLTAFNSDGFTLGSSNAINKSGDTFVSWNWKAGTSVSGTTTGSGTSKAYSGSVSTDGGFSIIKYIGNGTSGHTIPHHLGVQPQVVICKRLSSSGQWVFGSMALPNQFEQFLELDLTGAAQTSSLRWNDTDPSSSVFTVGSTADTNQDGTNIIAYSFAEKKGFSKFSSYVGNGSSDGSYIHLGFKPAFVLQKCTSTSTDWTLADNKRPGYNETNKRLVPNESASEATNNAIDFLSNGFKCRQDQANANGSGETYIYMAFAESPFVTSTGIPTTAR